MAPESTDAAPARRSLSSGGPLPRRAGIGSLADPAARRWVVLGALGIVSSLLLTVAVALLSGRGVASADVPAAAETAKASRVTMVREIGGAPRSPTPGTGTTAIAPAAPGSASASASAASVADAGAAQSLASNALRQLRRVGRAMVTVDGIRRLALGGAVPFTDGSTVTAAAPGDDSRTVALADADPHVTLGESSIFFRLADSGLDGILNSMAQVGQQGAVALASPAPFSATSTTGTEQAPAAATPATATSVPATATSVPSTATSMPATATSVPATATSVPATVTPIAATATTVPATATSVPASVTPIAGTATP